MTFERFNEIVRRLQASGRMQEIHGPDGHVKPSERALEKVERDYADKPADEKWRLAQAQTIIDLAEKYQSELN